MTGQELLQAVDLERSTSARKSAGDCNGLYTIDSLKDLSHVADSVLDHAVATFGSPAKAIDWLRSECGALNHRVPLELLHERKFDLVDEELSRIDHGAYV